MKAPHSGRGSSTRRRPRTGAPSAPGAPPWRSASGRHWLRAKSPAETWGRALAPTPGEGDGAGLRAPGLVLPGLETITAGRQRPRIRWVLGEASTCPSAERVLMPRLLTRRGRECPRRQVGSCSSLSRDCTFGGTRPCATGRGVGPNPRATGGPLRPRGEPPGARLFLTSSVGGRGDSFIIESHDKGPSHVSASTPSAGQVP